MRCATTVYSKLGANASRLNLRSPPPASSSLFKKALTPNCSALSVNTSSSASSFPRFKGPFRRPSSSHRFFWADLMKATKCRSTEAVADNAAVSPCAAADSWADAIAGVFSRRRARGSGARGRASVIKVASGVSGAWPAHQQSFGKVQSEISVSTYQSSPSLRRYMPNAVDPSSRRRSQ